MIKVIGLILAMLAAFAFGYSTGYNVGMVTLGDVAWPSMRQSIELITVMQDRLEECKRQQADY